MSHDVPPLRHGPDLMTFEELWSRELILRRLGLPMGTRLPTVRKYLASRGGR